MQRYLDGFSPGRFSLLQAEERESALESKFEQQTQALLLDEIRLDELISEHWTSLGPLICKGLMALITGKDYEPDRLLTRLFELAAEEVRNRPDEEDHPDQITLNQAL